MLRAHGFAGLVHMELHAIEFVQQIVRKFEIGLVDLVDQQHRAGIAVERLPQLAGLDVVAHIGHARIAEL